MILVRKLIFFLVNLCIREEKALKSFFSCFFVFYFLVFLISCCFIRLLCFRRWKQKMP